VGAGVIDRDYRGTIKVLMFNFSDTNFEVKPGDRIAQLICERIWTPDLVEEKGELETTIRGDQGLGSTGVN
jgi:dUTP pyrophosphatase